MLATPPQDARQRPSPGRAEPRSRGQPLRAPARAARAAASACVRARSAHVSNLQSVLAACCPPLQPGLLFLRNACGIRYRKKRREVMGLDFSKVDSNEQSSTTTSSSSIERRPWRRCRSVQEDEVIVGLRAVGFGKGVVLKQRQRMRRKRCFGEEERAAILLMALFDGGVYT